MCVYIYTYVFPYILTSSRKSMYICILICIYIHMYISGHDVPKQESGEEGKNDRAALNRHPQRVRQHQWTRLGAVVHRNARPGCAEETCQIF